MMLLGMLLQRMWGSSRFADQTARPRALHSDTPVRARAWGCHTASLQAHWRTRLLIMLARSTASVLPIVCVRLQVEAHALAQDQHASGGVANRDVMPFLHSLAKKGDTTKAGMLGRIYQDGTDGVQRDEAEAFRYTLAAAEGGAESAFIEMSRRVCLLAVAHRLCM